MLRHKTHITGYDIDAHIPTWAMHTLTQNTIPGCIRTCGTFYPDPLLPEQHQSPKNICAGTHYQRGHIVPRADLARTIENCRQSYMLTNFAPQLGTLNQGTWATLENTIREWTIAAQLSSVNIITGTCYQEDSKRLGQTIVPDAFYKIILHAGPTTAYLIPQNATGSPLKYIVSIAQIEEMCAIQLPIANKFMIGTPLHGNKTYYEFVRQQRCMQVV